VLGLALVLCSLLVLAYSVWPSDSALVRATVEATLFAPP
jgi:hypothetical protein